MVAAFNLLNPTDALHAPTGVLSAARQTRRRITQTLALKLSGTMTDVVSLDSALV